MNTTELEAAINTLNMNITTLTNALDANTQALGNNTLATGEITKAITTLSAGTGEWRQDDNRHHKAEEKLDQEKLDLLKQVKEFLENKKEIGYETKI